MLLSLSFWACECVCVCVCVCRRPAIDVTDGFAPPAGHGGDHYSASVFHSQCLGANGRRIVDMAWGGVLACSHFQLLEIHYPVARPLDFVPCSCDVNVDKDGFSNSWRLTIYSKNWRRILKLDQNWACAVFRLSLTHLLLDAVHVISSEIIITIQISLAQILPMHGSIAAVIMQDLNPRASEVAVGDGTFILQIGIYIQNLLAIALWSNLRQQVVRAAIEDLDYSPCGVSLRVGVCVWSICSVSMTGHLFNSVSF